jgi:signal transduction histidine kinase
MSTSPIPMRRFITQHRALIERQSRDLLRERSMEKTTESELERGVPVFIDQLLETLGRERSGGGAPLDRAIVTTAAEHGSRLFARGFSMGQLVHGYGVLSEVVMELGEKQAVSFTTRDVEVLNRIIVLAIGGAVTEYQRRRTDEAHGQHLERVGTLAHEMRNALSTATMSYEVIKRAAGVGGRAADALDRSLLRMRDLVDRALTEVRLQTDTAPFIERVRVGELLDQVGAMMQREAELRGHTLEIDVEHGLEILADRQLLTSAVSNLVQNGLKYTKPGGRVSVRGYGEGDHLVVEVADECGGLPPGVLEKMFQPFARGTTTQPGIGLGLPIVERAVNRIGGSVHVRDVPGTGCVFTIDLPPTKS